MFTMRTDCSKAIVLGRIFHSERVIRIEKTKIKAAYNEKLEEIFSNFFCGNRENCVIKINRQHHYDNHYVKFNQEKKTKNFVVVFIMFML